MVKFNGVSSPKKVNGIDSGGLTVLTTMDTTGTGLNTDNEYATRPDNVTTWKYNTTAGVWVPSAFVTASIIEDASGNQCKIDVPAGDSHTSITSNGWAQTVLNYVGGSTSGTTFSTTAGEDGYITLSSAAVQFQLNFLRFSAVTSSGTTQLLYLAWIEAVSESFAPSTYYNNRGAGVCMLTNNYYDDGTSNLQPRQMVPGADYRDPRTGYAASSYYHGQITKNLRYMGVYGYADTFTAASQGRSTKTVQNLMVGPGAKLVTEVAPEGGTNNFTSGGTSAGVAGNAEYLLDHTISVRDTDSGDQGGTPAGAKTEDDRHRTTIVNSDPSTYPYIWWLNAPTGSNNAWSEPPGAPGGKYLSGSQKTIFGWVGSDLTRCGRLGNKSLYELTGAATLNIDIASYEGKTYRIYKFMVLEV